jgi:ADP-ribose pyrophosphatase YjhB (NUDIX family)
MVRQARGYELEGQWSVPWGLVDPDETPEDAALRETLEESGITAEIEGLLGIQNLRSEGWLALIFLCRHVHGVPAYDGVETDGAAYFSLEEMDALDEPIEPWCHWLVSRVLRGEYHLIPPESDNPFSPRLAFL